MKKYTLLLCLWAVLRSITGTAQDTLEMAGIPPLSLKDTVYAGDMDTFYVQVAHHGPTSYSDTITVITAVRDTANSSILHNVDYTYPVVTMTPHDTASVSVDLTYIIGVNSFVAGINVIVIWPVAQGVMTRDSLEFQVYVIDNNGVNELDIRQLVKAFPNPSLDHFTIENNGKFDIEEVRIYDVSGCLVRIIKDQLVINTEEWSPGMYLVDVLMKNHQHHSVRVIKQK